MIAHLSKPNNFGSSGGTSIDNKNTILDDVDRMASEIHNRRTKEQNKPRRPDVEVILARPFSRYNVGCGFGVDFNLWGHTAVRYRNPDTGEDMIFNIDARKEGEMGQFYEPEEYFYGTDPEKNGEQKGCFNRPFMSIRIEHVDDENLRKLHDHYTSVKKGSEDGTKKFNMIVGPILRFARKFIDIPEYGNCAEWATMGLKKAGLVTGVSQWPTAVIVDIFENYDKIGNGERNNITLVYYEKPPHANSTYGIHKEPIYKSISPFQYPRSLLYGDLRKYVDVFVRVDEGTTHARVIENPLPWQPNKFRNITNHHLFAAASIVATPFLVRYGIRRGWRTASRLFFRQQKDKLKHKYDYARHRTEEKVKEFKFRTPRFWS